MDKKSDSGIFALWLNWVVSTGLVNLAVMLAPWVTGPWMALLTFLLACVLIVYMRIMRIMHSRNCGLVVWVEMRTLAISSLIMLVVTVFFVKGYAAHIYGVEYINPKRPFVTILVLAPVTFLLAVWVLIKGEKNVFCQYCKHKYGTTHERGFMGMIYAREGLVQIRVLVILTGLISALTWTYYFFGYVNVNFNGVDKYFLVFLPLFLWICTVIFFSIHYFSIWGYYSQNYGISSTIPQEGTYLRYLILHHDQLLLAHEEDLELPVYNKLDTPASIVIRPMESVDEEFARQVFGDLSGIKPEDFKMRFMYRSNALIGKDNVFHYIVSLDSEKDIEGATIKGEWYNLSQVQHLLERHDLAPILMAEINRLYHVTMAWKTYDENGRRLYHIKNYRPMFRLNGIMDWDVDFNDPKWLEISANNEDHLLFRLRKFFNRIIGWLH